MPEIQLSPGVAMFYRENDYTDPWRKDVETLMLLHGNAESSLAWNAWIPHLARRFRVIRPDMRGFGKSTPMPVDYPWSIDGIIDDFVRLADELGIERFHLAGAKIGGGIALRFAATRGPRVRTLTVMGARVRGREAMGGKGAENLEKIKTEGIEAWARDSMPGRLGSDCPKEMFEGWIKLMAATAPSTQIGFVTNVPAIDVVDDLPKIACPTLIVASEGSGQNSAAMQREWQQTIPHSELFVVPGNSFHVAATHPDMCAQAMVAFIERCGAAV